jgi:hypothetical protein
VEAEALEEGPERLRAGMDGDDPAAAATAGAEEDVEGEDPP